MDALLFDPKSKKLSFVELEVPSELKEDDVLVQVAYAGVCRTDLRILEDNFPCSEDPIVLGHEFSGIVRKVGSNITHLTIGDDVAIDPIIGCDTCKHCTNGNYHFCEVGMLTKPLGIRKHGGWAEYCLAPGRQVFKLPENISLVQAVLTQPISCISHGWDLIQPVPIGSVVLINGAGIIGNLFAAIFHLQGYRNVIVSEPHLARRENLKRLETGYEIVPPDDLKERELQNPDWGVDLVIDCSDSGPAIEEAVEYLHCGGKLVIFGLASPETKISISPFLVCVKELKIIGSKLNPFSFNKALDFMYALGDRYLDYDRLGIKTFRLKDYEKAIAELKEGLIAKAVFSCLSICR